MSPSRPPYDLLVVGSGYAGLSAALFAARRGLTVAICGAAGGLDYSSGLIDLLGVHPIQEGRRWDNPWEGIEALIADRPEHPYARVPRARIQDALQELSGFLSAQGLPYVGYSERNCRVITAMGGLKFSYLVPEPVSSGVEAWESKAPCLLVDFQGLKGYSARQICQGLTQLWPGLRPLRIHFPGKTGELNVRHMALALSDPQCRRSLAHSLIGHLDQVEYVGFPAILGLSQGREVREHLQALTQRRIFEIPTLPPSIAGARLRAAFERGLDSLGVRMFNNQRVFEAESLGTQGWSIRLGHEERPRTVQARGLILATGRFLSQGLRAGRHGITEPLLDLPVAQPPSRQEWSAASFWEPTGHARSRAGLLCDKSLRPLGGNGHPRHETLYAAGAVLAGQDWAREKCGAGLAIATAYQAVRCLIWDLVGGEA